MTNPSYTTNSSSHFIFVCLVTWSLTENETEVDFDLIQTSVLFI